MDQHLKQRPNHYATLGLTPGARSEDIERAFAQAVSGFMPRAFGSVTIVSVAYETLRDPTRRRAYDQSIGLGPPPPLRTIAVPASGTMPFVGSRATALRLAGLEGAPKPAPPLVEPEAFGPERVEPPPPKQPAPAAGFVFEPNSAESLGDAASLRPIVLGAVAMVVAAALFGAWMGLVSTEEVPAEETVSEVKADLPPLGPVAAIVAPAPPLVLTEERLAQPRPEAPIRRAATEKALAPSAVREEVASAPEPVTTDLVEALQTQTVEAVPVAAVASARMPLGDAAVARTIRKIGYPCGSVASTAAGSGAGVFVVTCTSGHSYRAAPINGRYRFKRL